MTTGTGTRSVGFRQNPFTSVGFRLGAAFLLVVMLVTVPLTVWLYHYAHGVVEERAQRAVTSLLEHDHGVLQSSVANHDYWQLFRLTRSLASPDYIVSAAVVDDNGRLLAHSEPSSYSSGASFVPPPNAGVERIPIRGMRGVIGELIIEWNHDALSTGFAPVRRAILLVTGAFAVLAGALGVGAALLWRNRLLRILGRAGSGPTRTLGLSSAGNGVGQIANTGAGDELDALEHRLVQALAELRVSQWILDSVQEYVLLVDAGGSIHHINRAVDEICTCGSCFLGRNLVDVILPRDRAGLSRALAEKTSGTLETEVVTCTSRFPALISFRHAEDMAAVTITDLTEYHRLKSRVEKLRALSILGEMSTELTHEVKNDMAPVRLLCQTAPLPEEDRRVILRSLDRINELVDDFMAFVRGEEQPTRVLSLRTMLHECCGKLSGQARMKDVTLDVDAPDAQVELPPGGFRMVVTNLVRNAIQAAPSGGHVWVEAGLAPDGAVSLSVADDGPGISPQIADRLFEPFVTSREGGTGLGLALAYRHVTQAGGSIGHAPRPAGGTVFTVRWVAGSAMADRAQPPSLAPPPQEGPSSGAGGR